MKRNLVVIAALAAGSLMAAPVSTFRANITGGGGSGKCTIEVEVDGAADVEISGAMGRLRTLSGQTATWRRMQCNQVMPTNPSNFRFRGIDGRGRQTLVRTPGSGPAVVRIEDPDGGREGYTFDLEWDGGYGNNSGYNNGGRYDNNDRYNNGNGRYDNGRYNNDRYNNDRYNNGRYGNNGNRFTAAQAIDTCRDEVRNRLNRDGYSNVQIQNADIDNNPGRNDWVIGTVSGRRSGNNYREFGFSCSVDFSSGRVRSVDLNGRGRR